MTRPLPPKWKTTTLGQMVTFVSGGTPSKRNATNWGGEFPWLSAKDMKRLNIDDTEDHLTAQGAKETNALAEPGTTLVLVRGMTLLNQIPVCIARRQMAFNQDVKALICRADLAREFLPWLLIAKEPELLAAVDLAGHGTGRLSTDAIAQLSIALPPLLEQRAIATALSDADALITALDDLLAKKRAMKEGAMQQLLTGHTRLPGFTGEWKECELGSLLSFIRSANNPRRDLADDGGVQYLHYGDVHAHPTPALDCSTTNLPWIASEKIAGIPLLKDGDLVIADASEDLEGTAKSVEIRNVGNRNIIAGLHTIVARGEAGQWALGFKAYLQFIPQFKRTLERVATGISVYAISRRQVAELTIRLPPVPEQEAIVRVLTDMDAEVGALELQREKARQVKQGMMQQLLTGRVRLVKRGAIEVTA